ncbi:MAG: RNA 2',3'-cyclic phosphodiesterase [Candidatus Aenigmarchaeota archaeon]|nr:RNA 2',3'-cyclic phosphodiesterase [Candidatus Aenigmarchaeota archaeon]
MRLFVGVDIPEGFRKKIADIQEQIGSKNAEIRFMEPKNLHYTLKFLGDVEEDNFEEVKNLLSITSRGFEKFTASICNLGYFGSGNYVRVLWLGMDKGKEEFVKLAGVVDKKLSYIKKEDFEPSPHLTIGRVSFVKDKTKLLEQLKRFNGVKIGSFVVDEIKLKQSVLSPKGPTYKDEAVFKLR